MFGVSVPTYEAIILSFHWTASSSLLNLHLFAKIDVSGGTLAVEAIKHISLYVSWDKCYVRYELTWNHCTTKQLQPLRSISKAVQWKTKMSPTRHGGNLSPPL